MIDPLKMIDPSTDLYVMLEEVKALRAKVEALSNEVGVNRIEMKGDPKNPQPGDHFPVKVGEKWFDTVISEHGTQRFVVNGAVNALVDHQQKMFDEYWMKQRIANHPAVYSLNEIAVDYQMGKWSKEEMIEFYTMFGYSVSGFAGLSFVEDVEIVNPLWEE